jgi:hypothetical protein
MEINHFICYAALYPKITPNAFGQVTVVFERLCA